ncbi:NAD(P)/FAD-dependent oxidoreductase [Gordonia sp. NPDC003504]
MTERILIVGGGEAGLSVAVTLRQLGFAGEVVIVGDEARPPYQRPPLSKEFLKTDADPAGLELRSPEFFAEQRIDLVAGRRVCRIALEEAGGVAVLDDGSDIVFSGLALTTGSVPRQLPVPGSDLGGVYNLRTLDDAQALRVGLGTARDVVVVGGGFIGLEVAATARAGGADVTVVEAADRIMARVVAGPVSTFVADHHRAQGITVLLETGVSEVRGDAGRVREVVLADGRVLPADLVVVGVGAIPTIGIAQDLRLTCDGGIVVDAWARTSHPGVVAAGDCAVGPHPYDADRVLGVESVNNAVVQGKAAARSLLGLPPEPAGVPWFWSNQGELKIQIAGISDGYDQLVVRRAEDRMTVLYYRDGALIAADTVNNPREHMAAKRALGNGHTIDPIGAASPDVALKGLVIPIPV